MTWLQDVSLCHCRAIDHEETHTADPKEKPVWPLEVLDNVLSELDVEAETLLDSEGVEKMRESVIKGGKSLVVILPELLVEVEVTELEREGETSRFFSARRIRHVVSRSLLY